VRVKNIYLSYLKESPLSLRLPFRIVRTCQITPSSLMREGWGEDGNKYIFPLPRRERVGVRVHYPIKGCSAMQKVVHISNSVLEYLNI
jgi:hypothetical protein